MNNKRFLQIRICSALSLVALFTSVCSATPIQEDYFEMSLEELSQVIVSASKYEESLFDAPLPASVITAEKIKRHGATSIPEALRLVPGVIVREVSSGNYDVHIRGFDHVPQGTADRNAMNRMSLVMIDGRVIYNHYDGGVFWESLPIDLVDVDRIEVIRGTASAMYGPNALTGVIHIITKAPDAEHENIYLKTEVGNHGTQIVNGASSFGLSENTQGRITFNVENMERKSTAYYSYAQNQYINDPANMTTVDPGGLLANPYAKYPDQKLGSEREGFNVYIDHLDNNSDHWHLTFGAQESTVQKMQDDVAATPLTTVNIESWYVDGKYHTDSWDYSLSYEKGENETLGYLFAFDYENVYLNMDGRYEVSSWMLQPNIRYRTQQYDGSSFMEEKTQSISSLGLRAENSDNKLRKVFALSGDYYSKPDNLEISYLAGLTYTFTDKLLGRFNLGRAHQELFMYEGYFSTLFPLPGPDLLAKGNEDLNLVQMNTAELGVRYIFSTNWQLDAEVFYSTAKNFHDFYTNGVSSPSVFEVQIQDVPTKVAQRGATFNIDFDYSDFSGGFFVTLQDTQIEDQFLISSFAAAGTKDSEAKNTPEYFGGFHFSYSGIKDWTISTSGYFFDDYARETRYGTGVGDNKLLLNGKINYAFNPDLDIYLNIRSLSDDDSPEFALADEADATILIGVEADF